MRTVSLTKLQIDELVRVARDALPNESCAILLGRKGRILEILTMRNADESPLTFSIDPADLIHVYNLAESKELEVIAIFHSHPSKPSPSGTDRKFMEINPVIWIIYSTIEKNMKAFIYEEDIKEIGIKITTMG
jgi:proteasome lid subunit RPN8/RPN11